MDETFDIKVPGVIKPKERPRRNAYGSFYTPRTTKEAEETIAWYARAARVRFGADDLCISITFSESSPSLADGDNKIKTVLDALQKAEVYDNDRQIREGHWRFRQVPEGREHTRIFLWRL